MRVALVVPVALPCTPRGCGRGQRWFGAGRPAAPHRAAGRPHQLHQRHSPVGIGMRERCFNIRHSRFGVSPLPPSPPKCSPTAISTSVAEDSEISEAASSRGLAPSTMVEVTRQVTVRAVSRAFGGLRRLLVPVTAACFPRRFFV
jgi:hypothetical protein